MCAMVRCFLAIDLPEEIKEVLEGLQKELKRLNEDIRWVRPEGFHLTLKFFGNVEEDRLGRLYEVAEGPVKKTSPFNLTLKEIGFFPERKAPRVIWVGIGGEDLSTLLEFQLNLERAFEKLKIPREKRKFHPHLTLGRVKRISDPKRFLEAARRLKVPEKTFRVTSITFFKSTLRPEGAVYSPLKVISLK